MSRPSSWAAALAGVLITLPLLAQLHTTPNSIKYRDAGLKNATGRSGSASIEARALLNRDLTTTVEITTGSFESGAAAGTISRVQLKAAGKTRNFNGLENGGTFGATTDGLSRLEPVQIEAHVRDIDPARTDVVSATDAVKLRPDLSVVQISPPAHALLGFPADVKATIREGNGDAGARANCRLLAGGVEIDRAEGIWIDAGDHVDCRFSYTFESEGVKQLQVVVDGVNPGDWDDANNSASAELQVYDANLFAGWTASARDEDFYDFTYVKNPYHEQTREEVGFRQELRFTGTIGSRIALDHAALSTRVETDGQTVHDVPDLAFDSTLSNSRVRCRRKMFGAVTGTVCQDVPGRFSRGDITNIDLRYGGANTTYHSWGHNTMLAPSDPGLVYDYVVHSNTNPTRLGNTVSFDVAVSDGIGAWHAQPFISSLATSNERFDSPYRCVYSGFYEAVVCSEIHRNAVIRSGSASGQ
jgi:hypothetical protein